MMVDFRSRQEEEIEKLTRTLKNSRLATSESEARRMAEEMLGISKKVADDFREREKQIYGEQKKSSEHDLAHKQMEQLAANMAKGRSNARLDLGDLGEMRIDKPLKELVAEEEEPLEKEEDDAVEVNPIVEESTAEPEPAVEEAEEEKSSWDKPAEEKKEVEDAEGDADNDDDQNDDEEEKAEDSTEEAPAKEASDPEAAEEDDSSEADFSVKELDSAPVKSDDDREKEIESMEESKIDLSSMFNANK